MKNRTLIFLSTLLAFTAFLFHFSAKKQPAGDEVGMFDFFKRSLQWKGRLAPDFELDLLNGERFRLSDHVGKKVVVLNFFATWCGPCKEEMPELGRYYEAHKNAPFVFIGVNADERKETVRDFIQDYRVTFPVGIDKNGKVQKLFSVRAFPPTVFIGADGIVHLYEVGPIMNADIAFDAIFKASMDTIRAGAGIMKDAFLQRQKESPPAVTEHGEKTGKEVQLTGRRKTIAEKMTCPCGCSQTVMECECKTAQDIQENLKKRDLSGMTDAQVIKSLNQEFCGKDDKS